MPYKEEQPTLIGVLGIPVVTQVTKPRLFGGPYMSLYNLFEVTAHLYMTGAVLGRSRRNKLSVLAKMLVVPGTEVNNFIQFLQERAKKRLEKFRNDVRREPDRFNEFILFWELGAAFEGLRLSLIEAFEARAHGDKKVRKVFDEGVPIEKVEPVIKGFQLEGIGFGSFFPELTEKMYRNWFENIDMDVWSEARAHGLAIPGKPTIISLGEQEELVLQMVANYASGYYPELLDPLDLRGHLSV